MKTVSSNTRLHKSRYNRTLSGVCAGIGEHYNVPVPAVRVAAVLCGLCFPMAAVLGYGLAAVLLPNKR